MLVGENGIITQAQRAAQETEQAQVEEQKQLAMLEASVHLEEYEYTDANGEKVNIPAQCAVSKIEGENTLENGLVIIDVNGNEWVWIEVPRTEEVYPNAGTEIVNFTNSEYTAIETDLHSYSNEYRYNNMDCSDIYYSEETTGLTSTEYYKLKFKMLKSVYQNEGFWIGRYEAGTTEWRNEYTEIDRDTVPLSQANCYPFLFITCSEAEILAENVCEKLNLTDYTSSLMFGVQWDLVLKFMETKGVSQKELNEDSTNWGNYANSVFTLDRGEYALFSIDKTFSELYDYTENFGDYILNSEKQLIDIKNIGIVTTTGSSDVNCKLNIYDLAGNIYEWTLEYSKNSYTPCVRRGGSATVLGSDWPANAIGHSSTNFAESIGFRITIY